MRAHATGVFIAPGDFDHLSTWNAMEDFYRMLNPLHERYWVQALNFNSYDDATENGADESLLSAYRINFYLPSSPTKSDI